MQKKTVAQIMGFIFSGALGGSIALALGLEPWLTSLVSVLSAAAILVAITFSFKYVGTSYP